MQRKVSTLTVHFPVRSEVERELGLLFSRGKRQSDVGNKSKNSSTGFKFRMLVEDIREGVLVSIHLRPDSFSGISNSVVE